MMLGGACSPCCECSDEERYAIWQRLRASTCSLSAGIFCERQHAATSITPGLAHSAQGVKEKYFSQDANVFSAQRFFYRPTPDLSGSYILSVDLADRSTYWNGQNGVVSWRMQTPDVSLAVRAYVGSPEPLERSDPEIDASRYIHYPFQETERCAVVYAVSAEVYVYSFYTRTGLYDPAQFSETVYTGVLPPPGLEEFARLVTSPNAPISSVNIFDVGNLETGFLLGVVPNPGESLFGRMRTLASWWQQYDIAIPDASLIQARFGGTRLPSGLEFLSNRLALATLPGKYLYKAAENPTPTSAKTGLLTISYRERPRQWIANSDSNWMKDLVFSPFWNFFFGGLMQVEGAPSDYKYVEITADTFQSTFDVEFSES